MNRSEPSSLRRASGDFLRRRFETIAAAVQGAIDVVVVLFACVVAFEVGRRMGGPGAKIPIEVYYPIWFLVAVVSIGCFWAFGMYRTVKSLLNIEEFEAILKSTIVCFFSVITLMVFLRGSVDPARPDVLAPQVDGSFVDRLRALIDFGYDPASVSRVTLGITFALLFLFMCVSRFVSFKAIQNFYRRGIGNRNAVVVGTGTTARWLTRKFLLVPTLGLRLHGFVTTDRDEVDGEIDGNPVLGHLDEIREIVSKHKVTEAFVAIPQAEGEEMMQIVDKLEALGVTYRVVPRFYQLLTQKVRIETLDSIPLISRAVRHDSLRAALAKRVVDIVLGTVCLVLASPLLIVASIFVKRDTPGPILYKQVRIGKDGVPFAMYKFRTMYVDKGGDALTPKDESDPRITPVGRYLRRYSLDEIPQLFNVLKGDMSLVGPRPEMPFIVDTYGPLERERLRAKPGITGLWQISYARQQAIHANLDYDIYYVENRSLLLDVVILFLTVFAIVKGTGAH
ncbi:MAG: sugar transferase [Planctomycetota bacterium]